MPPGSRTDIPQIAIGTEDRGAVCDCGAMIEGFAPSVGAFAVDTMGAHPPEPSMSAIKVTMIVMWKKYRLLLRYK